MGEHRLWVFENTVLWNICWPKRGDVMRWWRRLHNEEFYDLFFSQDIIWCGETKKNVMVEHVACVWGERRG